jgi:hypothetical protein
MKPIGVLTAGRAGEDGRVKVERPQPKARTYDVDAVVFGRTLGQRRRCGGVVVDRPGAGVGILSLAGGGG